MKHTNTFRNNLTGRVFLALGIMMLGNIFSVKAADYYWVNGSGNWSDYASHWATSSGGNIFHTVIPTLNDDVYFDVNSFTASGQELLIDNTLIYCKSMVWTGVLFNPSVNGLGNRLHIYGSLTLAPAMSWSVKRIDFMGPNAGNTISTAGHQLDTLYFNSAGSFALTENTSAISMFIYDGSFATSGFSVTTQRLVFGTIGATVNGDIGNSTINISKDFKAYDGTVNLISANADLNFVNSVVPKMYLWASGQTFNNIYCQSNIETIGNYTCQQLTADGSFYINSYWMSITCNGNASFSGSTTLDCNFTAGSLAMNSTDEFLKIRTLNTGSLTANGVCGEPVEIRPIDFLTAGTINIPSGTVTVDYAIITSINATGGATYIANNSVDGGNNTGWTINSAAPRSLYWVGGTGNWEDETHWATTSGGTGGNCIPSLIDDVFFDANSFSAAGQVVNVLNSPATCKNMDWTGVTNAPEFTSPFTGSIRLYGSMILEPTVQWNIYTMEFAGSATGNTLFSAGLQITGVHFNGSGSWSLADELHCNGIGIYEGTFNSGNFDIYTEVFSANGNNSAINIDLGTSTLYLGERYIAFSSQLTISSANANIFMESTSATAMEFQGYNALFNDVTFIDGVYVLGKLTCNNFNAFAGVVLTNLTANVAHFRASFEAYKLNADNLIFDAGVHAFLFDSVQVNTTFTTAANCSNTLTLNKYSPFIPQATFISAININLDYAILTNINATGGGTFSANNSTDLGNNIGWTVTMAGARDLYWVGGTGVWDNNANWSTVSGGPGGECQPAMQDNVIFDSNSFAQPGDTVFVNPALGVYCNNLTFSGIPLNTLLRSSSSNYSLNVFGSLTFPSELDLYSIEINMMSVTSGNTIATGNNSLDAIRFNGSGEWWLQNDLTVFNFSAGSGTFHTNGFDINASGFNLGGSIVLDFSTSSLTALGFYSSPSVTIIGDSADIIMTSPWLSFEAWGAHFNSITFSGTANTNSNFSCNYLIANSTFTNINSSITAGHATFKSNVTLSQPFIADTIVLDNPGLLVWISDVTVNDAIISNGNSGFPIQIEGINGAGTIQKSTGQICLDYVLLKDITATGGAQFFAGANGVDLGGNSGWIFSPCIPLLTDVWPGDANYDLTADNDDILNIGLAYGYTGPVRSGASLAWVAQPATDWSFQFANTANLKHADTDGNGVVDADDTTAVSLNYGLFHAPRIAMPQTSSLPIPVLYTVTNPDTASLSDTVEVEIYLGNSAVPVDSIYGIAFTVNIDTALVNSSYLSVDYTGSWLGTTQVDMLGFSKNLLSTGKIDLALVRTDQQNITGFGLLARLGIVIVDNVGAKVTMPIVLTDIKGITASEYLLTITSETDSIVIDTATTTGVNEIYEIENGIILYPNPANEQIQIVSSQVSLNGYEIYNRYGILVAGNEQHSNRIKVNTSGLAQGLYFMSINTPQGKVYKKFEVVRK